MKTIIFALIPALALAVAGCEEDPDPEQCPGDDKVTPWQACLDVDQAVIDRYEECCDQDFFVDAEEDCEDSGRDDEGGCYWAEDIEDCVDDIEDLDCPEDCDDVSDDGDGWHNATMPASCITPKVD